MTSYLRMRNRSKKVKQNKLERIIEYFEQRVPYKGEIYNHAIEHISNNPDLTFYFQDREFFSTVHRGLIREGGKEMEGREDSYGLNSPYAVSLQIIYGDTLRNY